MIEKQLFLCEKDDDIDVILEETFNIGKENGIGNKYISSDKPFSKQISDATINETPLGNFYMGSYLKCNINGTEIRYTVETFYMIIRL